MVWGGGYVTNVCMYAALFRLYSGIITQTARRRARRRAHRRRHKRRRESIPNGFMCKFRQNIMLHLGPPLQIPRPNIAHTTACQC